MTQIVVDTGVVSFLLINHPIGLRYDPELAERISSPLSEILIRGPWELSRKTFRRTGSLAACPAFEPTPDQAARLLDLRYSSLLLFATAAFAADQLIIMPPNVMLTGTTAPHQLLTDASTAHHHEDWTRPAQWTTPNPTVDTHDKTGHPEPDDRAQPQPEPGHRRPGGHRQRVRKADQPADDRSDRDARRRSSKRKSRMRSKGVEA